MITNYVDEETLWEERVSRLIKTARHSLSEDWMEKKKNSRSKNRITKKKKREGDMHGFNLLNALARNRRTKRTHILGRSFASISICNRMHAYTCILSLFLCLLLGIFHVAFSTCRQSIRTLERAAWIRNTRTTRKPAPSTRWSSSVVIIS